MNSRTGQLKTSKQIRETIERLVHIPRDMFTEHMQTFSFVTTKSVPVNECKRAGLSIFISVTQAAFPLSHTLCVAMEVRLAMFSHAN